jgi:hypothetical protein
VGTPAPSQLVLLGEGWVYRRALFAGAHHSCLGSQRGLPYSAHRGKKSVNRQTLDDLKQQIPLMGYLQAHDWHPSRPLSRGRWMGLCPLHGDHKPSFLVDPRKDLFFCYGCPGGDPIAVALAAGETPSPEMVAASSEKEGFSPRAAWLCFAGIVASLVIAFLPPASQAMLLNKAPVDIPPEVLAFRAQDILKGFRYTEKPQSRAYGFDCCDSPNQRFVFQLAPAPRDNILANHQPPLIRFWYRQSQARLMPSYIGAITYDSPPNSEPTTMIRMALDATGRLTALEVRPAEGGPASPDHPAAFDWATLFKEARLDPARFKPSDPQRTPPMAFDQRMA